MSENSGLSEQSAPESVPGAGMEPTGAESVSPPPKKDDKKKLWIVIIAIIVVAALIGTALFVLMGGKELSATIEQDPEGDIAAGAFIDLSVTVEWGDEDVTDDDDTDVEWTVSPATLGEFDRTRSTSVEFEAGDEGGSGTISCEVQYGDATYTATHEITVLPPTLDSVSVNPSVKSLALDEEWDFTATAVNSVGDAMSGATFTWTVSGMDAGDYTLSNTSGAVTTFSASVEGTVNLTATATAGSETKTGTAVVNVGVNITRTVDYYWYDMFNHPIEEWYDWRAVIGNEEFRLTDEYPYLYLWDASPPGNCWIYTFMRLDMDANNLTEVGMNENPVFLPFFSDTVRGGNAEIDWYLNYITEDEGWAKLGPAAMGYFDGWYVALNGTVSLDEQAAMAVLDITTTEFDDFGAWWTDHSGEVSNAWESWMIHEASPERTDIFWMYDYPLQFVLFELDAEKVDDQVVLTFDTISWGAEALLTRWMKEAWMPTEWYFEDMTLQASIGPEMSQIDMDTAIQYAVYAYETTVERDPCWDWEALMQDYIASGEPPYDNSSLYDRYWDWETGDWFEYLNTAPGSGWYDDMMPYDYAPGSWNLSEGETLTLEWPAGEQVFFVHDPGSEDSIISERVPDVSEVRGEMTVTYAEPMPSDAPDFITIDTDARQIIYTGPFDMWTWSKEQTEHEWLAAEWERMSILPYGMPFVEFRPPAAVPPFLEISGIPEQVEVGEEVAFTVRAVDALTLETVTDYTGEVAFESTDLTAELPENYTFVLGDAGTHDFTVVFNYVDAETHSATPSLTVYDVDAPVVMGTHDDILVVESPVIDHFDVVFAEEDVYAEEPASATVTAYNQWAEVYTDYAGIAEFDSDDVGADLPDPLNFTGLSGESDVEVTFSTDGDHYLNVSDSVVTEATGSAMVAVNEAAVADYFVLSGVNVPAEVDVAETMTVTVYDQHGREFADYDGSVVFECNRSGDVTLPGETPWTLDETSIDVELTFTAGGMFTVWANDSVDDSISGELEVWVSDVAVVLDHFNVDGITNMWENNYSSVTVTAISNLDLVFQQYDGVIQFTSDAVSGDTLPDDYDFVPATDHGVKTFDMAVSFEDPGTYNVTVNDFDEPTKIGYQDNIVIEDLVATTLEATASVGTVMENITFSMTVTVYHQYDLVFEEYDGTVEFSSTDTSGFEVLPDDYTFLPGDAGTHDFTDEFSLSDLGVQTITVEDVANSVSDTVDVEVIEFVLSSLTYKIYDLFGEDWGPWWTTRVDSAWDTDRALTTGSGSMTWLYDAFGDKSVGILYTPYRWNIQGSLLPNLDVHEPMFMPTFGATQTGAEATVHIYGQYLTPTQYDDQWVPYWETTPFWHSDYYDTVVDNDDGWLFGAWVNVTMNRAAAEEWLGLPSGDDPVTWWSTNGADFRDDYSTWIQDQGNNVYDIYNGYEYAYTDLYGIPPYGPIMVLESDVDEVTLRIGDVTWGYEALLTRWLAESGLSMHQPYMEDFEMTLEYADSTVNVSMDAVAEWSMKAVKQNASATEWGAPCAWAWFPAHLDYIEGTGSHLDSAYDDYAPPLTYQSWNCGDPMYENETTYEYTPVQFTLPSYGRLIVDLPDGEVQGYHAEWVPSTAVSDAFKTKDPTIAAYEALMYTGEMELGYCDLSGAAGNEWFASNKTLIVQGPWEPTSVHPTEPSLMLTGAPWLEFNVVPSTMAASSAGMPTPIVIEEPTTAGSAAATSVTGELMSLATIICAATMLLVALVAGAGRRYDQ